NHRTPGRAGRDAAALALALPGLRRAGVSGGKAHLRAAVHGREHRMKIVERGVLSHGVAGTPRAALTFPCLLVLPSGTLLATLRPRSTKDSADEQIELHRSDDGGRSWHMLRPFTFEGTIDGAHGTLKVCYLTQMAPGRLIAAAMWVDRTTYPGQPLF